ncbi:universal stress protein [Halobacteriales archaeon Cl-PHB]
MYDDVLVPTDGSNGTDRVLAHALGMADDGATIHSVYVVDRRLEMAATEETKDDVRRSLEEEGEVALDDVRVSVEDEGFDCVTERLHGVPHREILDYAADQDVDAVVMGTHGHTGRDRIANLGSTTERVVQNGGVPVLVVDLK